MDLRAWRKSQKLRLKHLAPIFEVSIATLSLLERGTANVPRETIARIEGATGGRVTATDLHAKFKTANSAVYIFHRAAGRDAMAEFRKTATKTRK